MSLEGSFDVGGRSLYLRCLGQGGPTVMMEAGLATDHSTWADVQPQVARTAQACAYDRANVGRSDPAPTPRTSGDAVTDLHRLLRRAGLTPPFVLVGHSFGGFNVWLYAAEFPEEVAGLVLVDSSHPEEERRIRALLTRAQIREALAEAKAHGGEGVDWANSSREVSTASPLPPVPLVVVTAARNDDCPSDWPCSRMLRLHLKLQAALEDLTPEGRQILADANHNVHHEDPELVIDAIRGVVEEVRSSQESGV